jgi:3-dehydroquinate dehydratase-2
MKKIIIINGPNLNLLGKREPHIYGKTSFPDYFNDLQSTYQSRVDLSSFQSNHEGVLIDKLHETGFSYDGIIINLGAFSHTSFHHREKL